MWHGSSSICKIQYSSFKTNGYDDLIFWISDQCTVYNCGIGHENFCAYHGTVTTKELMIAYNSVTINEHGMICSCSVSFSSSTRTQLTLSIFDDRGVIANDVHLITQYCTDCCFTAEHNTGFTNTSAALLRFGLQVQRIGSTFSNGAIMVKGTIEYFHTYMVTILLHNGNLTCTF